MSLIESLSKKARSIRRYGLRRVISGRASYYCLSALRPAFGFDKWHSGANYANRPYKKLVVDLANSLTSNVVVELGCGLGDIVSRIRAKRRFGVDPEPSVIRAARFLHPFGVEWICGDATALPIIAPGERINCLLAINWIHMISRDDLAKALTPLIDRTDYFILDKFNYDLQPGRFDHDFAFFAGRATCIVDETPPLDDVHRFFVFKTESRESFPHSPDWKQNLPNVCRRTPRARP
jgi:hypothetical protein